MNLLKKTSSNNRTPLSQGFKSSRSRVDIKFDATNRNSRSIGFTFLDEKDKICFRLYDEYDHCNTTRKDNHLSLQV